MPKLPKRRTGISRCTSLNLSLRIRKMKVVFSFFCYTDNSVNSMPICANYSQNSPQINEKCDFRQIHLRLFVNASNQRFAKTMINRIGQSRKQFCTDRQQHSSNDALICCCTVVLVYNSKTSNKSISNGVQILRGRTWMM